MIFMNSEINKIDLGASFFRIFKIPMVKMYSAKKNYLRAEQILQESIFVIIIYKFYKNIHWLCYMYLA